MFKETAIIHEKGEFSKINESICNHQEAFGSVTIEVKTICSVLPTLSVSDGSILVNIRRDRNNRSNVYFERVRPCITYQTLTCQKLHNNFCKDISIAKSLSRKEMFQFSNISETQGDNGSVAGKNISDGKEINENI